MPQAQRQPREHATKSAPRSITAAALKRRLAARPTAEALRRAALREQLPGAADSLQRRRADLVPEPLIAELVGANWLEWSGGSLRLTETGLNICKQLKAGIK